MDTIQCNVCSGWYFITTDVTCPYCKDRDRTKQKRERSKGAEAGVLRECLKWLRSQPQIIYVERRTTGFFSFEGGGGISLGHKGAADIWCLIKEPLSEMIVRAEGGPIFQPSEDFVIRHIEIECKRRDGRGKLSADQQVFQSFCRDNHISYFVAISAENLEDQLRVSRFIP